MAQVTPVIYDQTSGDHRPAAYTEQISAAHIPVHPSAGNALKATADGLLVEGAEQAKLLSHEEHNLLQYGNDMGLHLPANNLLCDTADNLIKVDTGDFRIKVTKQDVIDAVGGGVSTVIVSRQSGNLVSAGNDGGAYLPQSALPPSVSSASGNALSAGADGGAYLPQSALSGGVSSDAGNILTPGSDGKAYLSQSAIHPTVVSNDAGNIIQRGSDGGAKLDATMVAPALAAGDKILHVTGGNLASELSATYDNVTGHLTLTGVGGQQIAQVTIETQGSVLESVSVVTDPPGQPAGTYLAMTFRKSDGTLETVYADLSAISPEYVAGSGISIVNRTISAKLAAGGGLVVDASGQLAVDIDAIATAVLNKINRATLAAELISTDTRNAIEPGTDGKLFVALDAGTI